MSQAYTPNMKKREYTEGPKALENFEKGMKAIFNAPKTTVAKPKKKPARGDVSSRKTRTSDRD